MDDLDENVEQQPAQQLSSTQIANQVMQQLAPQLQNLAPQARQQVTTAVDALVESYKRDGFSDTTINALARPAVAAQALVDQRLGQFGQQLGSQIRNQQLFDKGVEVIDSFFEKHEDDPAVAAGEIAIRANIHKALQSNPSFMSAWSAGILDAGVKAIIKKTCKDETDKFGKAIGRESASRESVAPPLRTSGNANAIREAKGDKGLPVDEDNFNEHQRALFNAAESFAGQKLAHMTKYKTEESRKEWAIAAAARVSGPPNARRAGHRNVVNY